MNVGDAWGRCQDQLGERRGEDLYHRHGDGGKGGKGGKGERCVAMREACLIDSLSRRAEQG